MQSVVAQEARLCPNSQGSTASVSPRGDLVAWLVCPGRSPWWGRIKVEEAARGLPEMPPSPALSSDPTPQLLSASLLAPWPLTFLPNPCSPRSPCSSPVLTPALGPEAPASAKPPSTAPRVLLRLAGLGLTVLKALGSRPSSPRSTQTALSWPQLVPSLQPHLLLRASPPRLPQNLAPSVSSAVSPHLPSSLLSARARAHLGHLLRA